MLAGVLSEEVGTKQRLGYFEKKPNEPEQMPVLQSQGQSRDADILPLLKAHRGKSAKGSLRLFEIYVGILKAEVRQLIVDMKNGNDALFQFQTEERVLVSVPLQRLVEAN